MPTDSPDWGKLGGIGFEFAVAVLMFGAIGWWLDGVLDVKPWLLIGGFGFGFVVGLWRMIKAAAPNVPRLISAMTRSADQYRPVIGLMVGTIVAFVTTLAVLTGLLALANRTDWWRGLLAASVISLLAAGASLPPLLWSLARGSVNQQFAAYFVAMGIRLIVSLGGCVLAVKVGNYAVAPTLLMMVLYYFALLAVETTFVARTLWDSKH